MILNCRQPVTHTDFFSLLRDIFNPRITQIFRIFKGGTKKSAVVLTMVLFCVMNSWAAEYTWTGGGGTANWTDSNNWTGGTVGTYPDDNTDIATIPFAANITIPGDITIKQLRIKGTPSSYATISIASGATLTVTEDTHLGYDGNQGSLKIANGTLVTNELQSNGTPGGNLYIENGATVDVTNKFNVFDEGSLTVEGSGALDVTGAIQDSSGGGTVDTGSFSGTITADPAIFTWTGLQSGSDKWNEKNNWSPDSGYPSLPSHTAIFEGDINVSVAVESDVNINSIKTNTSGNEATTLSFQAGKKVSVLDTIVGSNAYQGNLTLSGNSTFKTQTLSSGSKSTNINVSNSSTMLIGNVTAGSGGINFSGTGTAVIYGTITGTVTGNYIKVDAGTFVWTGLQSSNWTETKNWAEEIVPTTSATKILITNQPYGATSSPYAPIINNSTTITNGEITIEAGGSLSVSSGTLSAKKIIPLGDVNLKGSFSTTENLEITGKVIAKGATTLTSSKKIILHGSSDNSLTLDSADITLNGNYSNSAVNIACSNTSEVNLAASSSITNFNTHTKGIGKLTILTNGATITNLTTGKDGVETELVIGGKNLLTVNNLTALDNGNRTITVQSENTILDITDNLYANFDTSGTLNIRKADSSTVKIPSAGASPFTPANKTPNIKFYKVSNSTSFTPEINGSSPYTITWALKNDTEVEVTIKYTGIAAYPLSFPYYVGDVSGTPTGYCTFGTSGADKSQPFTISSLAKTNVITLMSPCGSIPISTYMQGAVGWTGAVDSDWEDTANWIGVTDPLHLSTVDVVIMETAANMPVIKSNPEVNSLTIESRAEVTLNTGADLTVIEATTIETDGTLTGNAGSITTNTLDSQGSVDLSGAILNFTGVDAYLKTDKTTDNFSSIIIDNTSTNFELKSDIVATTVTSNRNVILNGNITATSDISFGGTTTLGKYIELETPTGTIRFAGELSGGVHALELAATTVNFKGNVNIPTLTFLDSTNIKFAPTADQIIDVPLASFSNITGTFTKSESPKTTFTNGFKQTTSSPGDVSIQGTIEANAGGLSFAGSTTLKGDTTLTATGQNIDFLNTVTGNNNDLTISNSLKTTFSKDIADINTLAVKATGADADADIILEENVQVATINFDGAKVRFNKDNDTTLKTIDITTWQTTLVDELYLNTYYENKINFTNTSPQIFKAGKIYLRGDISSNADLTFDAPCELISNVKITAGTNDVTFKNTLDSQGGNLNGLTVVSATTATFEGAVGTNSNLTKFDITAGTINIDGGSVTTTKEGSLGTQMYSGEVKLGADTRLTANTAGDSITFENSITGPIFTLSLATESLIFDSATAQTVTANSSPLTFNGKVTKAKANTLTFTNGFSQTGGSVNLQGTIVATNNNLSFAGTTSLTETTILTATNGDITLAGAITGANDLSLTAKNNVNLDNTIDIAKLTATATTGKINIDTTGITTTKNQTYTGAVELGKDTTLNSGSKNITFSSTVGGAFELTTNNTGSTTFTDAITDVTELSVKTGALAFNADTPADAQTSEISGPATLEATSISFGNNANDSFKSTTLNFTGNPTVELAGTLETTGNAISFPYTVTLGQNAIVTTAGGEVTFTGALTGSNNITINSGSGNISFNAASGNQTSNVTGTATINSTGNVSFGNTAGDTTTFTTLTFETGTTPNVELSGTLTTSNAIEFPGDVTIGQNAIVDSNNKNITFNGDLTGTGANTLYLDAGSASIFLNAGANRQDTHITGAVTLTAANSISFGNHENDTVSFGSFTINTGTMYLGGTIKTTGSQTYTCNIILVAKTNISAGANVTFNGTINSDDDALAPWDLSIYGNPSANAGTVMFGGEVGTGTGTLKKVGILDVKATDIEINGGIINTTGNQTYSSNITSTGAIELDADTGTIALNGDSVTTTGNTQTYKSAVTGDGNITFNATTINIDGASVTTVGSQKYNGVVTLGVASTLTTSNSGVHFESDVGGSKNLTINTGTATTSVIDFKADVTINEANFTATELNFYGSTTGNTTVNITSGLNNYTGNITINSPSILDVQTITFTNGFTQKAGSSGTVFLQDNIITTNNNFIFEGKTTLIGETNLTATAGTIRFNNKIDSDNVGPRSLTTTASTVNFDDAIGSSKTLNNFKVDASNITLSAGKVITVESQTYDGAVVLGADTELIAGTKDIKFTSTVNSDSTSRNLEITNDSDTIVSGAIGDTSALNLLSITSPSGDITITGGAGNGTNAGAGTTILKTTGEVTLGDEAGDNTIFGSLSFNSTVPSKINLAGTLKTTTSTSPLSFPSAINLAKNSTVTTNNASITFNNIINGTKEFTVNSGTADTVFSNNIGNTEIPTKLSVTGKNISFNTTTNDQSTKISGNTTLKSTGTVSFGNDEDDTVEFGTLNWDGTSPEVTLAGTLKTTSTTTDASAITLPDSVTLAQNATIETDGDNITVTGNITNTTAKNLTLKNAKEITFNGKIGTDGSTKKDLGKITVSSDTGIVTKTTFNDELYAASLDISATTIAFNADNSPVDAEETIITGAATLTTYTGAIRSGSISFGNHENDKVSFGSFTIKTKDLNLGGTITTTAGGQEYDCNIILVEDTKISTKTNTDVEFKGTINSDTNGTWTLDIFGSTSAAKAGNVTFGGEVGTNKMIASLDVNATTIAMNGTTIETTGNQSYFGNITLGTNTTLLADSGNLFFRNKIDGTKTLKLTANGSTSNGEIEFQGPVGETTPLTSLEAKSSIIKINTDSITTTGLQTYNGKVQTGTDTLTISSTASGKVTFNNTLTLKAKTTVKSNGEIQFDNTINGEKVFAVTGDSGSASKVTFTGTVGNPDPLTSLSVTATAINVNGGEVTTTGSQTYTGAVVLGGIPTSTTFTTTDSDISFSSTINGDDTVTANAGIGEVTYTGTVGTTTPLTSLYTTAGTIQLDAVTVTTTQNQTYNGATKLGENTTLNASPATSEILFKNTINSAKNLTITDAKTVEFEKDIGGTDHLSTIDITADTSVTFLEKVDAINLEIDTNTTYINGPQVFITENQIYGSGTKTGNVVIGANTKLLGGADGTLYIKGSLNGTTANTETLTIGSSGTPLKTVTFNGKIGDTKTIKDLTVYAGTGGITANNTVKLTDNTKLTATAGDILFDTNATLTTGGSFDIIDAKTVTFNNTLTLGGATNIGSSANAIDTTVTFNKAVNSATANSHNLVIYSTENIVFKEAVGTTKFNDITAITPKNIIFEDAVSTNDTLTLKASSTPNEGVEFKGNVAAGTLTIQNSDVHIGGASAFTVGTIDQLPKNLFIVAGSGNAVSFNSDLDVAQNIILFSGDVTLPSTTTTGADLVLLGNKYNSKYTGAPANINGLFRYNTTSFTRPSNTNAPTFGFPERNPSSASDNIPQETNNTQTNFAGTLADLGSKTITVGKNFYANGLDITGGIFEIPNNSSATSSFAEVYNGTIRDSTANTGFISAAEATDGTGNTGWAFARPLLLDNDTNKTKFENLSGTYTISDNIIRVEFNTKIENTNDEISAAVDKIKFNTSGTYSGGHSFATAYTDRECTVSTNTVDDISIFYIKIGDDTHRWNTDAVGNNSGLSQSTDMSGTHRTTIPNIHIPLAITGVYETLRDQYKNRIATINYVDTEDRCEPVLIAAYTGQEMHTDVSTSSNPAGVQKTYDAHNFIEFVYSEEVTIGDTNLDKTVTNVQSTPTLGDNISTTGLEFAGLAKIASGKLSVGSTDTSKPSVNALYRKFALTAGGTAEEQTHRVRLSIAGFVDGTTTVSSQTYDTGGAETPVLTTHHNWIGYINSAISPSGIVTPLAGAKDVSVNTNTLKTTITTTINNTIDEIYSPWDVSPPVLAKFSTNQTSWVDTSSNQKEIIAYTTGGLTVQTIDFHFFDNTPQYTSSEPRWESGGNVKDDGWKNSSTLITSSFIDNYGGSRFNTGANRTSGGIRATSLIEGYAGIKVTSSGVDIPTNSFSQKVKNSFIFGDNKYYTTETKRPGGLDTPYLALCLTNQNTLSIKADFEVTYNENIDKPITDLAGNKMRTVLQGQAASIYFPYLIMSLAPVGTNELFLLFSSKMSTNNLSEIPKNIELKFTDSTDLEIDESVPAKVLVNTDKATGFVVTLNRNVTYEDITKNNTLGGTETVLSPLEITGEGIIMEGSDLFARNTGFPLSTFAINVIKPLFAYDDRILSDTGGSFGSSPFGDGVEYVARLFDGSGTTGNTVLGKADINLEFTTIPDGETTAIADQISIHLGINPTKDSISTEYNKTTGENSRVWTPEIVKLISKVANTNDVKEISISDNTVPLAIPVYSDYNWGSGDQFQFLFEFDGKTIDHDNDALTAPIPLYALTLKNTSDLASLDLWSLDIKDVIQQAGGVTILNNVINTNVGEKTRLEVEIPTAGNLTIQVMTIDGNIVKTLHRGRVAEGLNYYHWDGTNTKGDVVARGMYFIRVVGPGIDETRKVMAVRD